jgi:hypothetical protein
VYCKKNKILCRAYAIYESEIKTFCSVITHYNLNLFFDTFLEGAYKMG